MATMMELVNYAGASSPHNLHSLTAAAAAAGSAFAGLNHEDNSNPNSQTLLNYQQLRQLYQLQQQPQQQPQQQLQNHQFQYLSLGILDTGSLAFLPAASNASRSPDSSTPTSSPPTTKTTTTTTTRRAALPHHEPGHNQHRHQQIGQNQSHHQNQLSQLHNAHNANNANNAYNAHNALHLQQLDAAGLDQPDHLDQLDQSQGLGQLQCQNQLHRVDLYNRYAIIGSLPTGPSIARPAAAGPATSCSPSALDTPTTGQSATDLVICSASHSEPAARPRPRPPSRLVSTSTTQGGSSASDKASAGPLHYPLTPPLYHTHAGVGVGPSFAASSCSSSSSSSPAATALSASAATASGASAAASAAGSTGSAGTVGTGGGDNPHCHSHTYAGQQPHLHDQSQSPRFSSSHQDLHSSFDFKFGLTQHSNSPAFPLYPAAHRARHHTLFTMSADFAPDGELARMQELSRNWEPEANGPLVSDRLPSSTITQEYANADPVYQAKTANLPGKYAYYRTCRGDGHCGWRAIGFCYFETLHRMGSQHKITEELIRLKSLWPGVLAVGGYEEMLVEDFADEFYTLLDEIRVSNHGSALAHAAFNDEMRALSIITYLKMITSTFIKMNPNDFLPYLQTTVEDYCKIHVDPANVELEDVSLNALAQVLTKPAGIGIEVLYLDRSPGDSVTSYSFGPVDDTHHAIPGTPTFHLLYRPGHYDILYKSDEVQIPITTSAPAINHDVVVKVNHSQTEHFHTPLPYQVNDFEIPGMSMFPTPALSSPLAWPTYTQYNFPQTSLPHHPQTTHARTVPTTTAAYPLPPDAIHQPVFGGSDLSLDPPQHSTAAVSPVTPLTPLGSTFPVPSSQQAFSMHATPFRPSIWEYDLQFAPANANACQTAIFKNSHYNTAHFNNPEFEPEQWNPEQEYNTNERSRKKSGSH